MSRREGRDSDSRRHSSRFDREPSPKRSRRDGKPETERNPSNNDVDENVDRDQKHNRRLQDALPLEHQEALNSKAENGAKGEQLDSDKKHNGNNEGVKRSADPTEVPRSRSYFQHDDDRGNGRSFGRRAGPERGRVRDSRDQHDERGAKRYDKRQRDEKSEGKGDDRGSWGHDRFFEMEANPPPPPPPLPTAGRKRPAFTEKKMGGNSENTDKTETEPENARRGQPASVSERREDRDRRPYRSGRHERPSALERVPNRGDAKRNGIPSREWSGRGVGNGRGGNFQERARVSGSVGDRLSTTRADIWKHDMFEEANKSPPRNNNEEDAIAKVEALLAS